MELLSQEASGCASEGREAAVRHTQDSFTPQGYGRPSGPGPGAGPPREPCTTGQVWPEDTEVGVRRPALGTHLPPPTSHSLRVPLHSLPGKLLGALECSSLCWWVLGHLACPPPPRLGLGSSRCRRKALRPTAGQVECSRMVPPTQHGSQV